MRLKKDWNGLFDENEKNLIQYYASELIISLGQLISLSTEPVILDKCDVADVMETAYELMKVLGIEETQESIQTISGLKPEHQAIIREAKRNLNKDAKDIDVSKPVAIFEGQIGSGFYHCLLNQGATEFISVSSNPLTDFYFDRFEPDLTRKFAGFMEPDKDISLRREILKDLGRLKDDGAALIARARYARKKGKKC